MKLDAKAIRYLTSEDFRVLQGVLISPPNPAMLREHSSDIRSCRKLTNTLFLGGSWKSKP